MITGIYIPIKVWNKLNIKMPKGAVCYEIVRTECPQIDNATTTASPSLPDPRIGWFNIIWANYPKPIGKKQALKHFLASVETGKDWSDIQVALENYKKTMPDDIKYVKHGSTWFNNWQDYVQVVEQQQTFIKSL